MNVSVNLGGLGAHANGLRSIAGGVSAVASGAGSVVIGAHAKDGARNAPPSNPAGGTSDVVIGDGAESGVAQTETAGEGEMVAIGWLAKAFDWRATALGARAIAGAISSIAIGRGARALASHAIALGRGAFALNRGDITIGNHAEKTRVLFNNAHASRFYDYPTSTIVDRHAPSLDITLQGISGKDITANPLPNRPGGNFWLAGGPGTGTAKGGKAGLAVALPGAASGAQENPLVPVLWANESGFIEMLLGVELVSPNGTHWRFSVNDAGQLVSAEVAPTIVISKPPALELAAGDASLTETP